GISTQHLKMNKPLTLNLTAAFARVFLTSHKSDRCSGADLPFLANVSVPATKLQYPPIHQNRQ
ncbi:hypothetical protein, partial [Pseudocitrobacter faecalis]|uniref:hypothetical protein n=1 Tax=Pseudocitrobacter faecalis TaxID=1398493 RepID=UPI003BA282A4